MTPQEIAPLAVAALVGMIVPTLWRGLRRLWGRIVYRARVRPFKRVPPEKLDTQEAEESRTVHVFFQRYWDSPKELLYRGPDAVQAKHHFYRKGYPGTYTFWQGEVCRGRREADR